MDVAKRFHEDGFKITKNRKRPVYLLNESGIPAEKVKKLYEGRPKHSWDMITNGKIDLVVNEFTGRQRKCA